MHEMVQGDLLGPKKCLIIYLDVFITATDSLSNMVFAITIDIVFSFGNGISSLLESVKPFR